MVFSFPNWDFVYGHFPFYRAERERLSQYDGYSVSEMGVAGFYIDKLGPFPMFDRIAVKNPGDPDLNGMALRNDQQLFIKYMSVQRKEMMMVPFAFSTPIVILERSSQDTFLAMGNLCGQDNDGYFEFTVQTNPIKTDLMMHITGNRPLCDGFLKGNDNYMVYYLRIDQLEETIKDYYSIGFAKPDGEIPHIDVQLADKYYGQIFGFTNEGEYRI